MICYEFDQGRLCRYAVNSSYLIEIQKSISLFIFKLKVTNYSYLDPVFNMVQFCISQATLVESYRNEIKE